MNPTPTGDSSSFWMWVGTIATGAILSLFGLLMSLINGRITDVRAEGRIEVASARAESKNDIAGLEKDIGDIRIGMAESQRQSIAILTTLRELPTRTEMQHGLDIMETRLHNQINDIQPQRRTPS